MPAETPPKIQIVVDLQTEKGPAELAISTAELAERMVKAVEEAAGRDAEAMARLRQAVSTFTIAFRDIGTTPEQVLIALKTAINNRALVAIPLRGADVNAEDLRGTISTWCIEEFFRKETA